MDVRITRVDAGLSNKGWLLSSLEKCGIQPDGCLWKGEENLILFEKNWGSLHEYKPQTPTYLVKPYEVGFIGQERVQYWQFLVVRSNISNGS